MEDAVNESQDDVEQTMQQNGKYIPVCAANTVRALCCVMLCHVMSCRVVLCCVVVRCTVMCVKQGGFLKAPGDSVLRVVVFT